MKDVMARRLDAGSSIRRPTASLQLVRCSMVQRRPSGVSHTQTSHSAVSDSQAASAQPTAAHQLDRLAEAQSIAAFRPLQFQRAYSPNS